jgi:hypothetical protein
MKTVLNKRIYITPVHYTSNKFEQTHNDLFCFKVKTN